MENTYYNNNKQKILERQRKYFRQYYLKNIEKIQEKNRKYNKTYYREITLQKNTPNYYRMQQYELLVNQRDIKIEKNVIVSF